MVALERIVQLMSEQEQRDKTLLLGLTVGGSIENIRYYSGRMATHEVFREYIEKIKRENEGK